MFKGSYVALVTPFKNGKIDEAKLKDLEAGAETKTASPKPKGSKPQPDRLSGIWEDPFDWRKTTPT